MFKYRAAEKVNKAQEVDWKDLFLGSRKGCGQQGGGGKENG